MDSSIQNPSLITEDLRKKIYDDLAEAMISALEAGRINQEEGKKSAKFILNSLDNIKTKEELKKFLEDLGNQWNIYKGVLIKLKNEEVQNQDAQKLAQIQDKLNQLIN